MFRGRAAICKERFPKQYRHPTLDRDLTRQRVRADSRASERVRKLGLPAAEVWHTDVARGLVVMEFVPGPTVKDWIRSHMKEDESANLDVVRKMGRVIGLLHDGGIAHGDLTTSNFLVRESDGAVVAIDFGLAQFGTVLEEEMAVDLYVLERAFLSTHPHSEGLFAALMAAYAESRRDPGPTLRHLDKVRSRGRKRLAFG